MGNMPSLAVSTVSLLAGLVFFLVPTHLLLAIKTIKGVE
jgi:hypothetical protein